MNTNQHWYLLYCKPKQELRAQQHLANQGFTSFVPQITLDKLRGGKWQQVTEPLFPRYLFLHISNAEQLNFRAIRATRGITDFVRFGSALATVPDQLIQQLTSQQINLKQQSGSGRLKTGDAVSIIKGPFSGLNAVFDSADGEKRSLILVSMLGQWVSTVVDNQQLVPKNPADG